MTFYKSIKSTLMHLMVYSLFFLTYGILVQFWSEMTADLVINLTVEVSLWI